MLAAPLAAVLALAIRSLPDPQGHRGERGSAEAPEALPLVAPRAAPETGAAPDAPLECVVAGSAEDASGALVLALACDGALLSVKVIGAGDGEASRLGGGAAGPAPGDAPALPLRDPAATPDGADALEWEAWPEEDSPLDVDPWEAWEP